MLNSVTAYGECGNRAAIALNQRDQARYSFEARWLRDALAAERECDRSTARAAYDAAFRQMRHVPTVSYFR